MGTLSVQTAETLLKRGIKRCGRMDTLATLGVSFARGVEQKDAEGCKCD